MGENEERLTLTLPTRSLLRERMRTGGLLLNTLTPCSQLNENASCWALKPIDVILVFEFITETGSFTIAVQFQRKYGQKAKAVPNKSGNFKFPTEFKKGSAEESC